MCVLLRRRSILLFISVLVISACTPQSGHTQTLTQLDETFADNRNDWQLTPTDHSETKIENGELAITVKTANWTQWYSPNVLFPEDVDVQVNAGIATAASAPDWNFSIHVRASGRGSDVTFYTCSITETGRWSIGVRLSSTDGKVFKSGDLTTSVDAQHRNTIRCKVKGDQLSMYANDKLLATVQDSSLPKSGNSKYVHLSVYNGKNGSEATRAVFRDLKVKPS